MTYPIVLSHYQAGPLLRARAEGRETLSVSPDLGLSEAEVRLDPEGVAFPGGERLIWTGVEEIGASKGSGRLSAHCFAVEDGAPREISAYSPRFNRRYSLFPTEGAPTMLVSGFPMHRIKGTDPHRDTLEKIRAAAPVTGHALDTTMGLGYTAIEAARTATSVLTIELDPTVLEVARLNPWSRDLFESARIERRIGDAAELVPELPDAAFDHVLHDPPSFSLAGQLYSGAFYRELHRVLRPGGRVFHYIGNPESAFGARVTRGVVRRLREAGFARVVPKPDAFGLLAHK